MKAALAEKDYPGPIRTRPTWPGHNILAEKGLSMNKYAMMYAGKPPNDVSHQMFSYWVNGRRWAPLREVEKFRLFSSNRVRLEDWPRVYDASTGRKWSYGVPLASGARPIFQGSPEPDRQLQKGGAVAGVAGVGGGKSRRGGADRARGTGPRSRHSANPV